jgi:SSS family solute:Na+ symporter
MHILDWTLLTLPLIVVVGIAIYTQRYMKSVADFMSGGRVAGPYLLAVASGEMGAGAVVFVAMFELISRSGFTISWWQMVGGPIGIIVAISGFVFYRFRETRAMTLAQFFELRYSKKFRVFTGLLGFFAGIVNFGIIPAVGARCMVYFLGLPPDLSVWGWSLPTYIPLMGIFLGVTLVMVLTGGFLTNMITDCVEGIMSQIFYLIIIAALLFMFSWDQINTVLVNRPPGQSLINPFDSMGLQDFNLWYVLMGSFIAIYSKGAWQNASAYKSAAITPHASVMGGILGGWREMGKVAVVTLLAICAVTFLNHPDFASQATAVHSITAAMPSDQVRTQMEVPVALAELLPIGVKGLLCAILLMGIFGGDSTHLHSWGGIFVQDVLVPLRKKPFGPKGHIRALRLSILGVAGFAFFFGVLFRQTEYIFMWWTVTMAIYIGGAGACIIGGLYWKKGTTTGAWSALLAGSILSVSGIMARQIYGDEFPLNGTEISFCVALISIGLYVGISLLTCREDYNLERMLHRGKYAKVLQELGEEMSPAPASGLRVRLGKVIGINSNFTLGDKWIAVAAFGWSIFWFVVFVIGTIWNLIAPWPTSVWSSYWHVVGIGIPVLLSFVTAIWFSWGGIRDMRDLFRRLKNRKINDRDDGTVVDHQNFDEENIPIKIVP